MITPEIVYEKLKAVMDPELHVNIVDLGLVYGVVIEAGKINVTMTLTTPGCPLAPEIERLVKESLAPLGEYEINLELVWEPAWNRDRMSEEAKLKLGMI